MSVMVIGPAIYSDVYIQVEAALWELLLLRYGVGATQAQGGTERAECPGS